ncbi:MAG: hypothetical protein IPJ71_02280 [Bdellovibrionales bacterium]|nr:hypothetical protein [Bdellovibrionales bacterium]
MKNRLLTTIIFLSTQLALSGMSLAQSLTTDIDSAISNKSWIEGEVYFPEIGDGVAANLVCIDSHTNEYRYHRESFVKKVCQEGHYDRTDSRNPQYICTTEKYVRIPEKLFVTGPTYQQEVCTMDYTDSRNPKCVGTTSQKVKQIKNYRLVSCDPSDYRCEGPKRTEVIAIKECDSNDI